MKKDESKNFRNLWKKGQPLLIIKLTLILLIACFMQVSATVYSPGTSSRNNDLSPQVQQQRSVSGTVTDKNNQPLPGVTVVAKGTTTGTVTDADGAFSIIVPEGVEILQFSFVGMISQEISIAGRTTFTVVMEEAVTELEEVVAIGYGTQSRATLTTSVSTVDNKVLANIPYTNLGRALEGMASGVLVQSTSGQPGAAPRIIIRGGTSINNLNGSAPLYIVDGVIRPNINHLNSADIESIQILKDAASTSIYGARASNGVILITTKSGKAGQLEVIYNYDLTLSQVGNTYDMASAHDYIYYGRLGLVANERKNPGTLATAMKQPSGFGTGNDLTPNTAYTTQYLTPENEYKLDEGWKSMPDPLDPSKTIIYGETDWQDVLFRTGISNNHHISFAGGTDKVSINAGIGYLDDQGIAIRTGYQRFSGQLNGKLTLRDNLRLFANVVYSKSSDRQVYNITNVFFRSASLTPTAKYTFEDGSLAPGQLQNSGNPAYHLTVNKAENSFETITLTGGGSWEILPGLSFNPQMSMYKAASNNYSFWPSYLNGVNNWIRTRSASSGYSDYITTQADAYFSYNKNISKHNIDATAGVSYYGRNSFSLSASGNGAATDIIPTLNAVSTMTAMSSSLSDQVITGYFGRINYDYDRRYLVSLNLRYDGASNLGAKYKWGYFPGISFGWNLHEEDFWNTLSLPLNILKLRGSYGTTGNIGSLGDYQAQGSYSVGNKYMNASAIQNTVIPNPDLKWETSKTLNLGTDIGMFDQRIGLIFDVYRRVTDDLITNLVLPPSTGFSSISTNYGSLENKGLELELKAQIIKPQQISGFQWDISLNAAFTKHKILKLPENGQENNRVGGRYLWDAEKGEYAWKGGLQEGGRIDDYYSWKSLGVYSTDEEAASAPVDLTMTWADKTKYGGDTEFLDSDKNDTIDVRDMVYMGNPFPKWTGGFSSTMSFKGLELYVRTDFITGHTIYNHANIFLSGQWAGNLNFPKEMVTDAWKEQGDKARLPQYRPGVGNYSLWRGSAYHTTSTHSEYYESGNFLCIREVTLSYNLPANVLKTIKFNNVRLSVSGNNLYYFTKYKGMSPEDGGTDDGRYPLPRNFIFGVIVSL